MMIFVVIFLITIPIVLSGPVKRMFKKPELDDAYYFDDFVGNDYFLADRFDVIHNPKNPTPDEPDENPLIDFHFKEISIGYEFLVKTHFSGNLNAEQISWCSATQFAKLKALNQFPVYIFIGLGGKPAAPHKIYLIPLNEIDDCNVGLAFLNPYIKTSENPINFN